MTARWTLGPGPFHLGPQWAPEAATKLVADPRDGSLWALFLGSAPDLARRRDGVWEMVASGPAAFDLPNPYSATYRHSVHAYHDTVRKTLVYIASHYDAQGLILAELDGKHFVRLSPRDGVRCGRGDAFAFDTKRGVLVHVLTASTSDVGLDEERKKRFGGVVVRELEGDVWVDRPGTCGALCSSRLHAAWDEARGAVIVVDDSGNAAAWDGERWAKVARYPWSIQQHTETASTGEGRLVMTHIDSLRTGPSTRQIVMMAALGEKGWKQIDTRGAVDIRGGACDPVSGKPVFLAPFFGTGTCPTLLGAVDDGKLVPVPPYFPPGDHVVSLGGGRVLFQGLSRLGADMGSPDLVLASEREQLAVLDAGTITPLPAAEGALHDLVRTPKGPMTIGWRGEVFAFEPGAGMKPISPAPPGFAPRQEGAVAWIGPREALVLVGGTKLGGHVALRETWQWAKGAWSAIKSKGKHPVESGGHAAFDEARGVLVLTGGKRSYKPTGLTSEWDGKRWTQFPSQVAGTRSKNQTLSLSRVFWDPGSTCVIGHEWRDFYAYRGEGRWERLGSIAPDERGRSLGGEWAFEPETRRIIGHGPVEQRLHGRGEAALGDLLDAAGIRPDAPKRAAKKEEKALPDARYLALEDGTSKKFWIGEVKGSSLSMHWGRRGTEGQRKTIAGTSADAARAELAKRAQKKNDEGYTDSPAGAACAKMPGKDTWVMKLVRRPKGVGRGVDRLGGLPPAVDAKTWPRCRDCGHPMEFVLLLHANDTFLPLHRHRALAVFTCNGHYSSGSCETFAPDASCNAVLLLDEEALGKKAVKAPPAGPKGPPAVLGEREILYEKVFEVDTSIEEDEEPIDEDKAGGFAGWLQGEETPDCKKCKKPMRFVAQIDERDDALNFGGGRAYVFVCDEEHEGRFLWQQ